MNKENEKKMELTNPRRYKIEISKLVDVQQNEIINNHAYLQYLLPKYSVDSMMENPSKINEGRCGFMGTFQILSPLFQEWLEKVPDNGNQYKLTHHHRMRLSLLRLTIMDILLCPHLSNNVPEHIISSAREITNKYMNIVFGSRINLSFMNELIVQNQLLIEENIKEGRVIL